MKYVIELLNGKDSRKGELSTLYFEHPHDIKEGCTDFDLVEESEKENVLNNTLGIIFSEDFIKREDDSFLLTLNIDKIYNIKFLRAQKEIERLRNLLNKESQSIVFEEGTQELKSLRKFTDSLSYLLYKITRHDLFDHPLLFYFSEDNEMCNIFQLIHRDDKTEFTIGDIIKYI